MDLITSGYEHAQPSIGETKDFQSAIIAYYVNRLTVEDITQICLRFEGSEWRRNRQVLWSGLSQHQVQHWADSHGLQTLKQTLGPLVKKKKKQLSMYMKGASAIFAWYISHGDTVTVLSPPPPERFHPSKHTNYQMIEEPILKGVVGGISVSRIEIVHPTVRGADEFRYQIWPTDETHYWNEEFGQQAPPKPHWREIKPHLIEELSRNISAGLKTENCVSLLAQGGKELRDRPPCEDDNQSRPSNDKCQAKSNSTREAKRIIMTRKQKKAQVKAKRKITRAKRKITRTKRKNRADEGKTQKAERKKRKKGKKRNKKDRMRKKAKGQM